MSNATQQQTGTAVARAEEDFANVGLTPQAKAAMDELEVMRQAGMVAVEKRKVLATLNKMVQGITWGGATHGSDLSSATQYAIAEICYVTGANPALHLFVLAGTPYLNARFYEDLINQHPHFIRYTQRSLMPAMSAQLHAGAEEAERDSAKLLEDSAKLEMPELRAEAMKLRIEAVDLRRRAREIDERRIHYGIGEKALAAYETTIERYTPDAPLDAIRNGEVDAARFVQYIAEANWTDGTSDPVGKSNPDTTIRTRSLRRAGQKAFSAWMEPKMREVERFERQIEAEWRYLDQDKAEARKALPRTNGPQAALTGNGEPTAANAESAEPLPTREVQQQPAQQATNGDDLRKRYFATLRDAGHAGDRKAFEATLAMPDGSKFPASTTEWTQDHLEVAIATLRTPSFLKLLEAAKATGTDVHALAQERYAKTLDDLFLSEIDALVADLNAEADAEPAGQRRML